LVREYRIWRIGTQQIPLEFAQTNEPRVPVAADWLKKKVWNIK